MTSDSFPPVPAPQALDALFREHARVLSAVDCAAYTQRHGLPSEVWVDQPVWTDDAGRAWSLFDRVRWMGLQHPQGLQDGSLLEHFLVQDSSSWDKASPAVRQARVEAWLACQRQAHGGIGPRRGSSVLASIHHRLPDLLVRSLAKQPVGMPSSGLGLPGDGGWLGMALDTLEGLLAQPSPPAGWSAVCSAWWTGALLGTTGQGRWWGYGKVRGALKGRQHAGEPGWEAPGDLPGAPEWFNGRSAVRPRMLAEGDHWSRLAARTLNLLAQGLERGDGWRVDETLAADDLLEDGARLDRWYSPDFGAALARVARAGLLGPAPTALPERRYDGRALEALALLKASVPDLTEALGQEAARALAQALVAHQQAWEQSPRLQERNLAQHACAPRQRAPEIWAWATALAAVPDPPRRRSPGP